MFKACPEIHGNGPYLYLYLRIYHAVRQKDRHGYQHMIALITVFLWILYIIPLPNDQNACLFAYSRYDAVNIIFKVTNDPDARNIGQFISRHLNRDRQFLLFQLLRDADLAFDSLLNIMYRIFPAPTSVLRIQAVQPNLNDRQRLFIWLDQTVVFFLWNSFFFFFQFYYPVSLHSSVPRYPKLLPVVNHFHTYLRFFTFFS